MTTHDPLCDSQPEHFDGSILWPERCTCDLIAKVRADEREKVAQRVEAINPATATWPSDTSGHWYRELKKVLGQYDAEDELLSPECYECNGEQLSFALALKTAVAAVRGES